MILINSILEYREIHNNYIKEKIKDFNVVSLKANIPGLNKRIKETNILINYYHHLIINIKPISFKYFDDDEPMIIYLFSKKQNLKTELIMIEEQTSLGRFIDLDFFTDSNVSLNRQSLRKCYICDNPAFVCGRNKNHTTEELIAYIANNVTSFLTSNLRKIIDESILNELNLDPKFGLITPFSNGSHKDMNYDLMIKSKNVIIDDLVSMFLIGYTNQDLNQIFTKIRHLGIITEQKMFKETNNINTYKGLIFVLGISLASIGFTLSNNGSFESIFDNISKMTKGITNELLINSDTFGKVAYQKHQIGGIRSEVASGLINVQKLLQQSYIENNQLIQALIYLISNVDDTVLLKRCNSIKKYNSIKKQFKYLLNHNELINQMSKQCIEDNLSFGGSADLLIVAIVLNKVKKYFYND